MHHRLRAHSILFSRFFFVSRIVLITLRRQPAVVVLPARVPPFASLSIFVIPLLCTILGFFGGIHLHDDLIFSSFFIFGLLYLFTCTLLLLLIHHIRQHLLHTLLYTEVYEMKREEQQG